MIQAFDVLIRSVRVNDVFADHALDVVNHSSQAASSAGHFLTRTTLTRVAIVFATGVLLSLHWVHEYASAGKDLISTRTHQLSFGDKARVPKTKWKF